MTYVYYCSAAKQLHLSLYVLECGSLDMCSAGCEQVGTAPTDGDN